MTFEIAATPQEAVDRLELLYEQARSALRNDLQRFFETAQAPTLEERALYRYPMLRVTYEPSKLPAATRRGYAKFAMPGIYSTTVTQPAEFRAYLLDQLQPLVEEYGATIETGSAARRFPYPIRARWRRRARPRNGHGRRARAALPDPTAGAGRRRDRRRHFRDRRGRAAPAFALRRGSRRLLTAQAGALYRHRLARRAALGAADQLSPLCRPVRPAGSGRDRGRHGPGAGRAGRHPHRPRRHRRQRRRAGDVGALAPLPDAGLSPDPHGAARASLWSISASAPPTPRTSPTISRC
jgi:hypothetical protein